MGVMNEAERYAIFIVFLLIYLAMAFFNFFLQSQWLLDNLVAIVLLTFVFMISRWLLLNASGFILFNAALLLHNMGSFGWYEWTWSFIAYDNIVHLVGALVAAWIIFNFVSSKLHILKHHQVKRTVVDEHKVIFIFLVMASVAMLGTVVELIEFGGFVLLGPGEGMFFTGSGDGGYSKDDFELQYRDTMEDILLNTIGSIAGVLLFYFMRYKKTDWVRNISSHLQ
jgi:hypothetical protein